MLPGMPHPDNPTMPALRKTLEQDLWLTASDQDKSTMERSTPVPSGSTRVSPLSDILALIQEYGSLPVCMASVLPQAHGSEFNRKVSSLCESKKPISLPRLSTSERSVPSMRLIWKIWRRSELWGQASKALRLSRQFVCRDSERWLENGRRTALEPMLDYFVWSWTGLMIIIGSWCTTQFLSRVWTTTSGQGGGTDSAITLWGYCTVRWNLASQHGMFLYSLTRCYEGCYIQTQTMPAVRTDFAAGSTV